jgi:hypothetical protein
MTAPVPGRGPAPLGPASACSGGQLAPVPSVAPLCGRGSASLVSAGSSLPIAALTDGGARAPAAGQLSLFGSTLAAARFTGGFLASAERGSAPKAAKTGASGNISAERHGPPGISTARLASEPYRTAAYIAAVAAMNISLFERSFTGSLLRGGRRASYLLPPGRRRVQKRAGMLFSSS